MKVLSVEQDLIEIVTTEKDVTFKRLSEHNWSQLYSTKWEPLRDCEEIEQAYQEYVRGLADKRGYSAWIHAYPNHMR